MNEEKNEESRDRLYMPAFVPDREDVIEGYGKKEIYTSLIILAICCIIAVVLYLMNEKYIFLGIFLVVGVMAPTLVIVRRDRAGENFIDQMNVVISYYRSQKKYYYEYTDPYDAGKKELDNGK